MTLMVHLGCLAYESKEETVLIPNEEVSQEFILEMKRQNEIIFVAEKERNVKRYGYQNVRTKLFGKEFLQKSRVQQ